MENSSEANLAAGAAWGMAAVVGHKNGLPAEIVGELARQAARCVLAAEEQDERMAAVLMARVSYGHGPAISDEEIARVERDYCRACRFIPCRCKGGN